MPRVTVFRPQPVSLCWMEPGVAHHIVSKTVVVGFHRDVAKTAAVSELPVPAIGPALLRLEADAFHFGRAHCKE